jgi:Family of unknown function (DUF6489)
MDVTITVNLTPAEARELMGLPDIQPLQNAALARMQDSVLAQVDKYSADGLLNTWFGGSPNSAMDAMRGAIGGVLTQGLARSRAKSPEKEVGRE